MSTIQDDELKIRNISPCPFCGAKENEDVFFGQLPDVPKYKITCIPCDVTLVDDRPDKVIANWNRRASESHSKGMKERYEEALEAQGKYILFLTHHYNNMYGLAAVHGFVCSDEEIKKGELLRKEIYNQQILVQKEIESDPSNPVVDEGWISVKDAPLFTKDEKGNWIATEAGCKEFIAAVPYESKHHPGKDLWWIRLCVIEDETGLCVVGDDSNEPAGWNMTDVTHYQLLPKPPNT